MLLHVVVAARLEEQKPRARMLNQNGIDNHLDPLVDGVRITG